MRLLNVAIWTGAAIWAAYTHRWMAVGFGLMAMGQACIALFWVTSRQSWGLVVAFGGLTYVGIAEIVASGVGSPATERFWIILLACCVVFAPILLLARRLGRRRGSART